MLREHRAEELGSRSIKEGVEKTRLMLRHQQSEQMEAYGSPRFFIV